MRNVVTILALTFIFGALAHVLTQGDLRFGAPPATAMDDYFIATGQQQTAANNIVTSIVFDFRGFDTLGEATVLFTAVLGVGILLRRLREDEEECDS
jgi:multisubunit Na+/H+ antiporter MnhB subunit